MSTAQPRVIRPGDPAPDFALPAVHRDGTVSLADYRGRSPVLLAFFRGIYCPFCRRHVAKLGLARDKLLAAGIETLAILSSNLDRTRLYFKYRPTRLPLAVDPDLASHRAFGISRIEMTPELQGALATVKVDAAGELPQPVPVAQVMQALQEKDRFELTDSDKREAEEQFPLDTGQFLVDRDGIVRWAHLDLAQGGLETLGRFPTDEELVQLARSHVN